MASSTVSITAPRVAVPMRSTRAMARATVAMARAGRGSGPRFGADPERLPSSVVGASTSREECFFREKP